MKNLDNQTGTIDTCITNRIQEMDERFSGVEDTIEEIGMVVKEYVKSKKFLSNNIQKI
jgi:hypothetical protein